MISNVHTHTVFCDGQNTPRELADRALELGFSDLGFSSHAPTPFDPNFPGLIDEKAYRCEIAALKEEYRGRLGILCGVEQEYYCPVNRADYDYIIGSVHYIPAEDGTLFAADDNKAVIDVAIRTHYDGNCLAMARDYYGLMVKNAQKYKPDIIGHFDLITKFNGGNALFDEISKTYRDMALGALDEIIDAIQPYGGMIEVNTSVMVRGLKDVPYPAPFLMRRMAERGVRAIITTDCHNASSLNAGFEAALDMLRSAGYKSMAVLENGRFADVNI